MNYLISTLVLLVGAHVAAALPRYLLIPRDNAGFVELSPELYSEPSIVRVARHVEAVIPIALAMADTSEVEPTSRIERVSGHILDYVDFGGHTGEDGAFGWYADFPVQR